MRLLTEISPKSIREFCELSMPILMFDKDENFSVLRLEDVSLQSSCCCS